MSTAANLVVRIAADATGARRGFAQAETAAEKFGRRVDSAALVAGGALAAVATAALDAGRAAAEFADASSAAAVIFGDSFGGRIVEWSKTAASTMGMSAQSAVDAANQFATFGKAAGLSGADLEQFAKQQTQLAADLASFNGSTPEAAITAIGAALRGESEPIRQFGVLLDDATLRNEALKLGLISTTKDALTPSQKVLASQSAILKQTTDAQGDFGRTSDSVANQQKTFAASVEDAKVAVGTHLQPAMEKLLPKLVDAAKFVGDNSDALVKAAVAVAAMSAAIVTLSAGVKAYNTVMTAATIAQKLWTAATNADTLARARALVQLVAFRVAIVALNVVQGIIRAATVAWTAMQWLLNAALTANPIGLVVVAIGLLIAGLVTAYKKSETFRNIVDSVARVIKTVAVGAFRQLSSAVGWVIDKLQTVWNKIKAVKDVISNGLGAIGSVFGFGKSAPVGQLVPLAAPDVALAAGRQVPTLPTRSSQWQRTGGVAPVIQVIGALDPVAVAKQIDDILTRHSQRVGAASRQWVAL
jgi:hypothetical protein